MKFRTPLTERLGLRTPVLAAPLGRGSTPAFLAALAREGAMGFVALLHMPEPEVRQTLAGYLAAAGGGERFGVNLTLIVDQTRRLEAALDAGCRVVSLWQGDPAPYARRAKDAGAVVFWTVLAQPRRRARRTLASTSSWRRGARIALGACGVWMGTRFVASAESGNAPGYKERIAHAGFADLVETTLFDGGWPDSPHRVVRNSTVARWEAGGRPAPGSRPGEGERIGSFPDGTPMLRHNVSTPWASMEGDWEAGPHYAGASAALVREVEPVAAILARIEAEAEAALRRALPR